MKLKLKESNEKYLVTVFDPDYRPTRVNYGDYDEVDMNDIYEDIYIANNYQDAVEYSLRWSGKKNRNGRKYIITIEDEDGNEEEFDPSKSVMF